MEKIFNQKKYIQEFNKQNYDKITIQVKKGYKEKFKNLAKANNMSMAEFIMKLVDKSEGSPL